VSGSVPLGKSCVGLVLVGSAVYSHFSPKGSWVTGHRSRVTGSPERKSLRSKGANRFQRPNSDSCW